MAKIHKEIRNFTYGIVDDLEPESIPVGSASSSLNFRTEGDQVALRRGYVRLGSDLGAGATHGLHISEKADGTQVLFKKVGRKLYYYDTVTEDWIEVGTDIFPEAAEDDMLSATNYSSQAGAQMFFSTPNSETIFKILTANPGSYTDLATSDYAGRIEIIRNELFLWARRGSNKQQDLTGLYRSWIDNAKYTTVSAESVGSSGSTSYNYTLAFKAGGAKRTCFGVAIKIGGTVKLTDDFNGNLVHVDGSSEGSGTINYTTGDITVSLTTAAGGAVTVDYQWEDSTSEGLADFSFSAIRVAGEGDIFRQDSGGPIQSVHIYGERLFILHRTAIYRLVLSTDDSTADNNVYISGMGIPGPGASLPTGDGIYFIDDATENKTALRLLTLSAGTDREIPLEISTAINLDGYRFDLAWMVEQGDAIHIGCRTADSSVNNRVIIYDRKFKTFDIMDLYASDGVVNDGSLVLGDNLTKNSYLTFSGFDDDEAVVYGEWLSNIWNLGFTTRLKKLKKLVIEGLIGHNQIIDVLVSLDRGTFVSVGTIRGDGSYVDSAQAVSIGSETIGKSELGGGSNEITAHHFVRRFDLKLDKFMELQVKFAVSSDEDSEGIGYFSVSRIEYRDIRLKEQKLPSKYR